MNVNMAAGQDEGAEKLMVKYIGQKVREDVLEYSTVSNGITTF